MPLHARLVHCKAAAKPARRLHVLWGEVLIKRATAAMTDRDYHHKLDELERLLNDPDVAMEPSRVWCLLAEVSQHDRPSAPQQT